MKVMPSPEYEIQLLENKHVINLKTFILEPIEFQNLVAKMEELAKPQKFWASKKTTKFHEVSRSFTKFHEVPQITT